MVPTTELNAKPEACEAITNTKFSTIQNTIEAVLEELRHLRTAQVHRLIQNV